MLLFPSQWKESFGLTVREEYGGIGLSVSQEVLVNYELGRTAAAFRSVFGTNIGIGSQGILMDGTPEQKAEYLPRVASGELIMSFALTEPDAGTDAASLKTRAVLEGDRARCGWRLVLHRAGQLTGPQARQERQEDGPARYQNL